MGQIKENILTIVEAVGAAIVLMFVGGIDSFRRGVNIHINSRLPNARIPPEMCAELTNRGLLSSSEYLKEMREQGYEESRAELYRALMRKYLSPEEILLGYWRGVFSEKPELNQKLFLDAMKNLGYIESDIEILKKIHRYYPPPQDFIRFAVRDVFRPDRVKKYHLDAEFPEDILPYVKKAGMDEEVLRWYWRAHWELPGVMEVIRMVNMLQPAVLNTVLPDGTRYGEKYRAFGLDPDAIITTYDDMDEYLATADISPYWRDRLKALTFPPLTRVDLRRIYALGLISDEELMARLLELGYSKYDAEKLSEFYKMVKNSQGRDLTLSQLKKLYEYREISREEAIQYLQKLGYDKDEAEMIISLWEFEEKERDMKEKIDTIVDQARSGIISIEKASDELDRMNVNVYYRDRIIAKIQRYIMRSQKLPSKEDAIQFLKSGIINEHEFREIMRKIGYPTKYVNYYVQLVQK